MQLLATISLLGFLAFTGVQGAVLVAVPSDGTAYSHDIHSMICVAFGNPMPQISWSKSGTGTINPQNMPTVNVNNTSVMTADGTQFFVSILSFCALRLSDAGTYSCTVQSAANDQYSFLNGMQSASFSLSVSIRPPELGSFSMDMDHGRLSMSFTKPLNITTFKPIFTLQNSASGASASYSLTNNQPQSTVDTGLIVIVLTPTDLDNVKATRSLFTSMSDSYLSFSTGGTRDLNGAYLLPIGMNEAVQVITYTADFQRPTITSVDVFDLDSGSFDVTFSEAVDPDSLVIGRVSVQNTLDNPSTSYTLLAGTATALSTPRNIRITMSVSDSAEVKIIPGLAKNISSVFVSFWDDAIADFANNRLLATKFGVENFVPDSSPAGLSCFSLDLNTGTVQLSFNDIVSQSTLMAGQIRLQSSQSSTTGYQLLAYTFPEARSLFILANISQSTLFGIKSDTTLGTTVNNTYISAAQGFIRDIYGVQSLEVPSTNAIRACQVYPDTMSPAAIGFTLDLNQGELLVTFNEPVSPSSYTPAMIRFMSGSTNLPALSGGNAFTIMGNQVAVRVKLSAADLQNIHNDPNIGLPTQANMTSLRLNSGAFSDYASNPILGITNLNAQMVLADTTPPTLSSFTLNLITGQFFLTFSEPVTISSQQQFISSISITNSPTSPTVSLTAANSPSEIMFAMPTSNTVTLTLPNDLHQLIDDSSLIATSANNVHINFDATNGVTDLVSQQLVAGYTQASGIVRLCVNNTYNSVADGTCESCLSVCRDGCAGPNPTVGAMGCTRCELLQVDSNSNPVRCFNPSDGCPVGAYQTSDGQAIQPYQTYLSGVDRSVCLPCHPLCAQCTGSSSTACSACSHAAVKLQSGVMCLDSCVSNTNCYYCDDQCNGCRNNATDCVACKNDMMIWQGRRICVPNCNSGNQFLSISPSGNSECVPCDAQCSSMGCTGRLNTDCNSCRNYSQYTSDRSGKMCVGSCPNGYYANASMFCLPCSENCKRCIGPSSTQCNVCTFEDDSVNRVTFVNCLKSCPTGYTLDVVGGDCDLIVAVWLVPLLFLLIAGAVIAVLLIVGFVCLRTSKTKAKKGFSDQEDFAHHIDNPVYSTNKSDTASMKSDFET